MNAIVITIIYLQRLKNETHVQFNRDVNAILVKYGPEQLGIILLYNLYLAALNDEMAALDFIRKSIITAKITAQDHKRDLVYRGFCDSVKGATHHFDALFQEAAELILELIKHYGNIAKKSFNDETVAMDKLIAELNGNVYSNAIALLGFRSWVDKLREENDLFSNLMKERYVETANKISIRMQNARVETDKYYHAIVNQIENQWLVGDHSNEACIKEWNAVIEKYKHILAQEIAERKKSSDETETETNTETETETEIENND